MEKSFLEKSVIAFSELKMTFVRSTAWQMIRGYREFSTRNLSVSAFFHFFPAGATVVLIVALHSLQYFGFQTTVAKIGIESYYFIDEDDSKKSTTSNTSKVVERLLSIRKPCWNYGISSARCGRAKPRRKNVQSLPRNLQWFVQRFVRSKSTIGIETSPSFCLCTCSVRKALPNHLSAWDLCWMQRKRSLANESLRLRMHELKLVVFFFLPKFECH